MVGSGRDPRPGSLHVVGTVNVRPFTLLFAGQRTGSDFASSAASPM